MRGTLTLDRFTPQRFVFEQYVEFTRIVFGENLRSLQKRSGLIRSPKRSCVRRVYTTFLYPWVGTADLDRERGKRKFFHRCHRGVRDDKSLCSATWNDVTAYHNSFYANTTTGPGKRKGVGHVSQPNIRPSSKIVELWSAH